MNTGEENKMKRVCFFLPIVFMGKLVRFQSKMSLFYVQHVSRPPDNYPVDDLDKGDEAEAEKESEESSKRGDEVHWPHLDASLIFWGNQVLQDF